MPDDTSTSGERMPDQALAARLVTLRSLVEGAAQRSGRPAEAVTLLAVTKTVAPEIIRAAYDLGVRDFGENRVQEAADKRDALPLPEARWELIGHLQRNKINRALALFGRVQSVDSLDLARALDRHCAQAGIVLPVLLEVNVAGEASKFGFAPEEVAAAAHAVAALSGLRPEGLMTVAPLTSDPERVRPVFRQLRELAERARDTAPAGADGGWRVLSMGMSDDFEVAIEEGATVVRLGRALFGARS